MEKCIYKINVFVSSNGVDIEEREYPILNETNKTVMIESGTLRKREFEKIFTKLREDMYGVTSYSAYTDNRARVSELIEEILLKIDEKMQEMAKVVATHNEAKEKIKLNGLESYVSRERID